MWLTKGNNILNKTRNLFKDPLKVKEAHIIQNQIQLIIQVTNMIKIIKDNS